MTRLASWLGALAVLLGFLVGSTPADQEPEEATSSVVELQTDKAKVEFDYPIPYATSPQPARLRIPSIDVAADINPVGMSDAVTMQVPADITVVGWFDDSVLPISDIGHTVLVGHRDGVSDPNGVFRNLGQVRIGDPIKVLDQAGRKLEYTVKEVTVLRDDAFAQAAVEIFRTNGPHRLVLITCGGPYDASRGGYQANVVVLATPS